MFFIERSEKIIDTYEDKIIQEPSKEDVIPYENSVLPSISRSFFTSTPSYDSQSNKQLEYLKEAYKLHIHTNSPEPQKFGAKAFVKNGEIYIAPGEENTLKHELAHIYQQKTKNIPATDEINGQKVNTDPKLEKEADEIAQNIDSYIPKIISPGFNGNNVMQFGRRKNKGFRRSRLLNIAQKKGVKKY